MNQQVNDYLNFEFNFDFIFELTVSSRGLASLHGFSVDLQMFVKIVMVFSKDGPNISTSTVIMSILDDTIVKEYLAKQFFFGCLLDHVMYFTSLIIFL